MYAIIETGGKQYKVSPGETLKIEKISLNKGEEVTFDKVLMINKEGRSIYGSPYVNDAKVTASIEKEGKAKKIIVFKQKPRKGHRKLRGHRQPFTVLKIEEIIFGG